MNFEIKIANKQICFYSPPRTSVDVIIFDETSSDELIKYVINGLSFFVYHLNPEKIFISPSIIYYFLKSLRVFNYQCAKIKKRKIKKIRALIGELLNHYRLGCFQFMSPKVVITTIDNDRVFQWISQKHKGAQYFAIQNGNRTKRELMEPHKNYLTNYFCFGDYEQYSFEKFGHYASNYIPVGSLIASIYKSKKSVKNNQMKYDICFVSQWKDKTFNQATEYDAINKKFMENIDNYLKEYIDKTGKSLCIGMRGKKDSLEYNYYKNLYEGDAFLQPNFCYSTYKLMDISNMIITFFSTSAREAFGWNKKVLFIDYSKDNKYAYYKDGLWILKEKSYDKFEKKLNMIINTNNTEYKKKTKSYANFVMKYDPDVPTYIKIRNEITKHL